MQWRRRRRVLVVVGSAQRPLLLKGLRLSTPEEEARLDEKERLWLESPRVSALRGLIQRYQQDDGSDEEESRSGRSYYKSSGRAGGPRYPGQAQHQRGTGTSSEKLTFNEDEYTRITTPRQDVLFKKGYLGRKRTAAEAGASQTNGTSGQNGMSNSSTDGDSTLLNGDCLDAECGGCGDGSDLLDDQPFYYPSAFVDPNNGMYYMNGGGYEMYDPYTGTVTVVVGPGPGGLMGLPPHLGLPPMEWFNHRLPPPHQGPPPHMSPPHMQQNEFCYMHGRKRYSLDSQNCSGPSSESTGSGPPSGPPSSPQECESGGPPSGSGLSPAPPPIPPMGPIPYPPTPHCVYPYMFGAPLYSLDGVSVHGGPQFGALPPSDGNVIGQRRKKKRRRRRRRGAGTDEGSEESSSEDNQLVDGSGASLSSQSVSSSQASVQATPTDSDAFTDFVAKHSTLNGDASAWEPSASQATVPDLLTPPDTPLSPTPAPALTHTPETVLPKNGSATESCVLNETPDGVLVLADEKVSSSSTHSNPPPSSLSVTVNASAEELLAEVEQDASIEQVVQKSSCDERLFEPSPCLLPDKVSITADDNISSSKEEEICSQNCTIQECTEVSDPQDISSNPVQEPVNFSLIAPQLCLDEISSDSANIRSSEDVSEERDLKSGIANTPKEKSRKGRGNKNENNGVNAKGENKGVNGTSFKEKRSRKNTSSNGAAPTPITSAPVTQAEETRAKASPSCESVPKQSKGPAARNKGSKKGSSKTDLNPHAEQTNGVMADPPPPPPLPVTQKDEVSLSLRPEAPQSWGRRPAEEAKPLPVEDVLLRALVGTSGDPPQIETNIPVDSIDPPTKPSDAQSSQPAQTNRLNPSSAAQRRPKKWRQNTKERAPTPGRELTSSTSSSPPSSLSSDEDETVIFTLSSAPPLPPADTQTDAHADARESPLRLTEAVTAWLRTHDAEEVLLSPCALRTSSSSDSESDVEVEEVTNKNQTGPKNEVGNPFLASSLSRSEESRCPGDGVEERVAEEIVDEAWEPLCDPTLFVAKYYRLGEDPPIMAMEFRDDCTSVPLPMPPSDAKRATRWADQQDSGVHSDESEDELGDGETAKTRTRTAQAEELASKSAYLLRQLKGQSPFPCGGLCCILQ